MTDGYMSTLMEIYLSGFQSGAMSAAASLGKTEDAALAISDEMTRSVVANEQCITDIQRVIQACLSGKDEDDPGILRSIENVDYNRG